MSDAGYKIRDQEEIHFITATVVQWIDVFLTTREYLALGGRCEIGRMRELL
jgi:hypothetical protein